MTNLEQCLNLALGKCYYCYSLYPLAVTAHAGWRAFGSVATGGFRWLDGLAPHQPFSTSKRAQRSDLLKSPQITRVSLLSSLVNAQRPQMHGPGSAPCSGRPGPRRRFSLSTSHPESAALFTHTSAKRRGSEPEGRQLRQLSHIRRPAVIFSQPR